MKNYEYFFSENEAIFDAAGIDYIGAETTSKLRFYYNFIIKNFRKIPGDIFEFGVFRGHSLLATAILLKKLGSKKIVYGFDSFNGFPSYHDKDSLKNFKDLKFFSKSFQKKQEIYKKIISKSKINVSTISTSERFKNTSMNLVMRRLKKLELNNVKIVKGNFDKTIPKFFKDDNKRNKIFCANIDCDLYQGYKCILEHIEKNLSKGAYVHLDEYYSLKFPGAKISVDEFLDKKKSLKLDNHKNHNRLGEFDRFYLLKV